jgi:hypothetical protein
MIVWLRKPPTERDLPEVIATQRYRSPQEALEAEKSCRSEGCVLVGDNPVISCIPLEALQHFHQVFSSSGTALGIGPAARQKVQIYEVAAP